RKPRSNTPHSSADPSSPRLWFRLASAGSLLWPDPADSVRWVWDHAQRGRVPKSRHTIHPQHSPTERQLVFPPHNRSARSEVWCSSLGDVACAGAFSAASWVISSNIGVSPCSVLLVL